MRKRIISTFFALILIMNIFSVALPVSTVNAAGASSYTPDATSYKYDKTVKIKAKKGSDISVPINAEIQKLRKKKSKKVTRIVLPAGTYKLKQPIRVYSNLVLDCTNKVTLTCNMKVGNMLSPGTRQENTSKKYASKYGTIKNVTVLGGTWKGSKSSKSTLIRMAHCSNITFDGCTFTSGAGKHQLELAALNNCVIKNCTFKDMKVKPTANEKCEALQFDAPCNTEVYKETYLDGTPMKNVTVTNCLFKNVPRGLGAHSLLMGAYHTNMVISDNTFENIPQEAIVALGFKNTKITGNTIKKCGGGILVQNFKRDASATYNTIFDGKKKYNKKFYQNVNCLIENNKITTVKSSKVDESTAIKVYGDILPKNTKSKRGSTDTIKKGDYRISGITIANNDITCYACGVHLYGTRNSSVTNNTITGTCTSTKNDDSIFVEKNCTDINIDSNIMKNSGRYGIMVQRNSTVKNITNNSINKAIEDGIKIYDGCTVKGNINNNTIASSKNYGIFVQQKSTVSSIANNTITNSNKSGIKFYDNCTAKGAIHNNTIKDPKEYGIFVQKKCTVSAITNNTITNVSKSGIKIYDGSTVTKDISGNSVTNAENGVFIHQKSSVHAITDNIIDKSASDSIKLYDKGNVKAEISRNTITNSTGRGICVQSISNNVAVNGNKITVTSPKAGDNWSYPVYVNTGNSNLFTINNNHLIAPSQDVSCVQVTSGKASCSNNICENGKYGISIESGTSSNTIGPNTYINCLMDSRVK